MRHEIISTFSHSRAVGRPGFLPPSIQKLSLDQDARGEPCVRPNRTPKTSGEHEVRPYNYAFVWLPSSRLGAPFGELQLPHNIIC